MFDDDDKDEEFLNEPIDGQMSIFELPLNNSNEDDEEEFDNSPVEGQYSLFADEYLSNIRTDSDKVSSVRQEPKSVCNKCEEDIDNSQSVVDDYTCDLNEQAQYEQEETSGIDYQLPNEIDILKTDGGWNELSRRKSDLEKEQDELYSNESATNEIDGGTNDAMDVDYENQDTSNDYELDIEDEDNLSNDDSLSYGGDFNCSDYSDSSDNSNSSSDYNSIGDDCSNSESGDNTLNESLEHGVESGEPYGCNDEIDGGESLASGESEKAHKSVCSDVFAESDSLNTIRIKTEKSKERKSNNMDYENTDIKGKKRNDGGHTDYRIQSIDEVLHNSMIPYSEFVLLDRALPRVEDGLKPVQRRILYTMIEQGLTPDKPFRKCAKVVGDCLGKYHPHGDTSVYDAMVRMAQPYNMRGVLVQGHGNFGSIDGDSAAAMRYTEAKLAPLALELLRDIDKDTVNWSFNFDDSLKEPDTLPGRFPNLLVNGAMGIAVGLATNIPPHNLNEVIDGVVALIEHPNIPLKDMMKIIKGPDFPTGGIISTDELYQAYETGRGKITIRAKTAFEDAGAGKTNIVISEIPYQKNKASLLAKIADIREDKKGVLLGIQDIKDESDRKGMRAVITVKAGYDASDILKLLFKYSDLQSSFGINMVAIADGKPKQLSLMQILKYYLNYQVEIIVRRTKFDLNNAKERLHILEGLHIAIVNIDEVVQIIKTSKSTTEAKQRLRECFLLSEKQAQAILDMRLARLTSLEVYKIEQEMQQLRELIEKLTAILNSKKLQLETIKTELLEIKRRHSMPRATKIVKAFEEIDVDSILEANKVVEDTYVALTYGGTIKRMQPKHYETTVKEFSPTLTESELNYNIIKTTTDKSLVAFTNKGNAVKIPVESLKEVKWRDKGATLRSICKELDVDEKFVAMFEVDDKSNDELLFVTKQGMSKRTLLNKYAVSKQIYVAIKLKEGDALVSVCKVIKGETLLMVTKQGMALNCDVEDIAVLERVSQGAKAMSVNKGDNICYAGSIPMIGELVLATQKGFGKRINLGNIELGKKANKGTKVFAMIENDSIVFADVSNTNSLYAVKFSGNSEFAKRELREFFPDSKKGKGKSLSINKNGDKINIVYKFNS